MHKLTEPACNTYNPDKHNQIQLIAVPAFNDNYLWMVCKNNHALVVDPGQAQPIQTILQKYKLTLDAILITHHHHDHVGGVLELAQQTGATVYGPAQETLPVRDHALTEGDQVKMPQLDLALQVIDVPGHTAGHIAYYGTLDNQPILFCGDTLFAGGCGRIFEGTPQQMYESLNKLAVLNPATLICCAHEYTVSNLDWACVVEPGNKTLQERTINMKKLRSQNITTLPSTLSTELETNPFLRVTQTDVVKAVINYAGVQLNDTVAVFAYLREWKNNF